ncbi:hypothetical protein [Microbulbifer aggregans]|nr:hypothetical protein [Microbulbifer aggregans]
MAERLLYRADDRKTVMRLGAWIGCLALLMIFILLGILILN